MVVLSAEVQHWQASLLQLQEETEHQRALQQQSVLDKESQLASVKAELLSQTQQLDSCQARVSVRFHPPVQHTFTERFILLFTHIVELWSNTLCHLFWSDLIPGGGGGDSDGAAPEPANECGC